MRCEEAVIIQNTMTAAGTWMMILRTSLAAETSCGQFVQVQVPGFYLRRPISVCRTPDGETMVLVYKTVGEGTARMAEMKAGETVNLFGPLGNGFPVEERDVLLIGGGVGVPPLLETAARYRRSGHHVTAVLGFNDASGRILEKEFAELGCDVYTATMDGSYGTKGTVMDSIRENHIDERFVMACGPLPMLKAVSESYDEGYVSLEARMACGMGACMGCVVKDQEGGSLRVCKDGPVFAIGKAVL